MAQVTQGISIDQSGWTGAELQIGYGPIDTYVLNTELGVDIASHYDVLEDIIRWTQESSRVWNSAGVTFSWEFTDQSPRYGIDLIATASVVYGANSTFQTMCAWPASAVATTLTSTAGVDGTCDVVFRVADWAPWVEGEGIHARDGGCLPDAQVEAPDRATYTAYATQGQVMALANAGAGSGATREAVVYQASTETWRSFQLSTMGWERGSDLYSVTLEGVG